MDDPILNCVLTVCCPPAEAEAALAKMIHKGVGPGNPDEDWPITEDTAQRVAAWMLKHFDLAEKGTLQPLKDSIVRVYKAQR